MGGVVEKILPIAASFIPGVGPLVGGFLTATQGAKAFGASSGGGLPGTPRTTYNALQKVIPQPVNVFNGQLKQIQTVQHGASSTPGGTQLRSLTRTILQERGQPISGRGIVNQPYYKSAQQEASRRIQQQQAKAATAQNVAQSLKNQATANPTTLPRLTLAQINTINQALATPKQTTAQSTGPTPAATGGAGGTTGPTTKPATKTPTTPGTTSGTTGGKQPIPLKFGGVPLPDEDVLDIERRRRDESIRQEERGGVRTTVLAKALPQFRQRFKRTPVPGLGGGG